MKQRVIQTLLFAIGVGLLSAFAAYCFFWIISVRSYPVTYGVSFNQIYATQLGLDWKETYTSMLDDLQPEVIRIAAMWSEVEGVEGEYRFEDVDFMMEMASAAGAKVTLVVGQKAPRWPECHVPGWVGDIAEKSERKKKLMAYVDAVVNRYKDHEALEFWQVENEAFIRFEFGECANFEQDFVPAEVAQVRTLDPDHRVVMTDSGELSSWRRPAKYGDILGTTLYRIVRLPSGRPFSYSWLPPGFYKAKARLWGKGVNDFFVMELQAEPWFFGGDATTTPAIVSEQTLSPDKMQTNIEYAQYVGASRVYFWGVEWWYFMKELRNDDRYWNIAKEVMGE